MEKKEKYEKEITEVIKKNNIFVIKDIFAFYTGIKSSQFYNLGLEKSESILKALDDNKTKTCQSLKNKWYKSDNPTLQIALFKTICSDEEAHRLNGSSQKLEVKADVNMLGTEEREKELKELEKRLKEIDGE
jgi:hypothetical protein